MGQGAPAACALPLRLTTIITPFVVLRWCVLVLYCSLVGQVRVDARPVKVYAEATIIMPLLVAQTFAREPKEEEEAAPVS